MITLIGQIAAAIAALTGLAVILYKQWWSPKAKARRESLAKGKQAASELDASGVTAEFDRQRRSR